MRKNGGYATFQQLNQIVDFSTWKTKTPQASVRQIVQVNDEFFRIKPGLWALTEYKEDVLRRFDIVENNARSEEIFTHSYYQGIIVELGNMHNYVHGGLVSAQHQLAGAVVVGNDHAAPVGRFVAGGKNFCY